MLISVKMPTIVGILTFMSRMNFMLSSVEHEKEIETRFHFQNSAVLRDDFRDAHFVAHRFISNYKRAFNKCIMFRKSPRSHSSFICSHVKVDRALDNLFETIHTFTLLFIWTYVQGTITCIFD